MDFDLLEIDGNEVIITSGIETISYNICDGFNYPYYVIKGERLPIETIIIDLGREYISGEKEEILESIKFHRVSEEIEPGNYSGKHDSIKVHQKLTNKYGFIYIGVNPQFYEKSLLEAWKVATGQTQIPATEAASYFANNYPIAFYGEMGIFISATTPECHPYSFDTSFILDFDTKYIKDVEQEYEYLI